MSAINQNIYSALSSWAEEHMPQVVHQAIRSANANLYYGSSSGGQWEPSLAIIRAWLADNQDILPAYYDYQTGAFYDHEPESDDMAEIYDISDSLYAGLFGKELAQYI